MTTTYAKPATSGQVQSLVRALGVLETLAEQPDGMKLSEISRAMSLPRSTAHRLLSTMQSLQFVDFDDQSNRWFIGSRAFSVGAAFGGARDLARIGRPFLRAMNLTTSETVNIAIADRDQQLYIGQTASAAPLPATYRPGGRLPLHYGAAGKSIMAFWSDDTFADYVRTANFSARTDKSTTDAEKLHAKIRRGTERGYAFDCEECAKDLRCVGAPIFGPDGSPIAALSISAPINRMEKSRMHKLGSELKTTASRITEKIGGVMPVALAG